MNEDIVKQPIKIPLPLFRRIVAFQQSKKIGLDGIILSLLDKIVPKIEGIAEPSFPDGFFIKTSELEGDFVCRLLKTPSPLMARLVEYSKTRQVTIGDIIIPVLDKGLPKLDGVVDPELPAPLFPAEFSDIDKSTAGVLLERQFSCPFDKTVFTAPGLKSKALNSRLDDFYMTEYTGVIGDRPFADYSLFDIKICPTCLYANYEKGFRIYDSINKSWREPQGLSGKENYNVAMRETVDTRFRIAALAGLEGHRLFSAQRTLDDALVAVSIGIDSVSRLISTAHVSAKAGLLYTKGLFHIQQSRYYHKLEQLGKDPSHYRRMRIASLQEAMEALNEVESSMLQDKYFQGAHEILLYYFQKMVVSEFIGDRNVFDGARTVIRKLYGDYCLGRGKGTPAEKKAATLFFNAIDEGSRKYDSSRTLTQFPG